MYVYTTLFTQNGENVYATNFGKVSIQSNKFYNVKSVGTITKTVMSVFDQ